MSSTRSLLSENKVLITDGGIETHMIYHLKRDLNNFALFETLLDEEGLQKLEEMYASYFAVSTDLDIKIIIGSPTWRANSNHMKSMGYSLEDVKRINRLGAELMVGFRARKGVDCTKFLVGGDIGPAGDGYVADSALNAEEADEYHTPNILGLKEGGVDVIQAVTMTYANEAIGIVSAAKREGLPVVVLFTVEVDGTLPDGSSLEDAVTSTDTTTSSYTAYFGINCAHPSHMAKALASLTPETCSRIQALRVNASRKSHAELDEATELDEGDFVELGSEVAALVREYPSLRVVGGCCGCDDRHIRSIAEKVKGVTKG